MNTFPSRPPGLSAAVAARTNTAMAVLTLLLGLGCCQAVAQAGAAAALVPSAEAPVLTLAQAYQAAFAFDAQYRAARYDAEATREGVAVARASLLPSVNLNTSTTGVQGWRRFPNSTNQEVQTRLDYQAPQASLQFRLPLFNWDAIKGYQMSQTQSEMADLALAAQAQDLIDRVSEAYMRALLAHELRSTIEGQIKTIRLQLEQAELRLKRGEGTRVQVAQITSGLDLALARKIEADDQADLATRQLQRLTGLREVALNRLSSSVGAEAPAERLTEWLDIGLRLSPPLKARQRAVELARQTVSRQYAGHMPRVDVVASLSHSENDSVSNLGQSTHQRSIGIQLSVPLYNGGGVDAGIRQAVARQSRAEEDLRDEREALEVDLQRFHQSATNGARMVQAYQRAVESAELAWQGARRSHEMGLGTVGEVAQSQSVYFGALRDLAQARTDQLLARVRLMSRAGLPADEITADIDATLARTSAPSAAKLLP